uniref:Uncharacterized protein n=1 Tax=Lepeophtheirus salmonis TaxID=72036 RepID=A0A0K2U5U8_LEPSM
MNYIFISPMVVLCHYPPFFGHGVKNKNFTMSLLNFLSYGFFI